MESRHSGVKHWSSALIQESHTFSCHFISTPVEKLKEKSTPNNVYINLYTCMIFSSVQKIYFEIKCKFFCFLFVLISSHRHADPFLLWLILSNVPSSAIKPPSNRDVSKALAFVLTAPSVPLLVTS